MYQTRTRLAVTADGLRAVPEDHTEAHSFYMPAGSWVPDFDARRLDLERVEDEILAARATAQPPDPIEPAWTSAPVETAMTLARRAQAGKPRKKTGNAKTRRD